MTVTIKENVKDNKAKRVIIYTAGFIFSLLLQFIVFTNVNSIRVLIYNNFNEIFGLLFIFAAPLGWVFAGGIIGLPVFFIFLILDVFMSDDKKHVKTGVNNKNA